MGSVCGYFKFSVYPRGGAERRRITKREYRVCAALLVLLHFIIYGGLLSEIT